MKNICKVFTILLLFSCNRGFYPEKISVEGSDSKTYTIIEPSLSLLIDKKTCYVLDRNYQTLTKCSIWKVKPYIRSYNKKGIYIKNNYTKYYFVYGKH